LTSKHRGPRNALAEAAAEVDIVVDYLWGKPAEAAIPAIIRRHADRALALRWVFLP
jgi:hypothetical protein